MSIREFVKFANLLDEIEEIFKLLFVFGIIEIIDDNGCAFIGNTEKDFLHISTELYEYLKGLK